ncbi:MAG: phosphoglucosamine mutase [Tissierellia bacterium]|nr:phosphoglucosamine mutase [Tissierellia bacterium]
MSTDHTKRQKLFGTDGIRGLANEELTPEVSFRTGQACGVYIKQSDRPFVLIGRDTRISGEMIASGLIHGLTSVGVDVVDLGVLPTPAVAYLVRKYEAAAGIVVSASHNPYPYNGIKIFDATGYKLPDEAEEVLEAMILDPEFKPHLAQGKAVGRIRHDFPGVVDYMDYLKGFSTGRRELKVVVDCANGALSEIAGEVLEAFATEVIVTSASPNGCNINDGCGSTHPEVIRALVKEHGAQVGFSFDGDADRIVAVDELGEVVDGDHILAITAHHLKSQGLLAKDTIVGTVMSNIGLDEFAQKHGMKLVKTKVGDRYVLEAMRREGYVLGGEQSGHIIFSQYNTTGDGLATGLHLLEVLDRTGMSMSALNQMMTSYPQVLVNAKVANGKKHDYNHHGGIQEAIRKMEAKFEGTGRVLIRPSGTEPLVRVMLEGENEEVLRREAEKLAQYIEEELA